MEDNLITRIIRAVKGDMGPSKRELENLISEIQKEAFKEGFKKGMESGRQKGYKQCLVDYGFTESNNHLIQTDTQGLKRNVDCAIIFIKADRGEAIVKNIKESGCLLPEIAEQLYSVAQKLWVGRESYYNQSGLLHLFSYSGSKSEFGPEYDSIAILINLGGVKSVDVSDSFNRHEFFSNICENKCKCMKISNRLPLSKLDGLSSLVDL